MIALLLMPSTAGAEKKRKGKVISRYEKLLEDTSRQTVSCSFMSLHRIGDKLYMELPVSSLGRLMMLSTTVSGTSEIMAGIPGDTPNSVCFYFCRQDSLLLLRKPGLLMSPEVHTARMDRIISGNYSDPLWMGFDIYASSPDGSSIVCEAGRLFRPDLEGMSPIVKDFGQYSITGKPVSSQMRWKSMKEVGGNMTVTTSQPYLVDAYYVIFPLFLKQESELDIVKTLTCLPEHLMEIRKEDPRIGVFSSPRLCLPENGGRIRSYSVAHRWRLEPSDRQAFAQGRGSEVKHPVTMYLDPNFPDSWKEPVRKGILKWNALFDRIGLRNAIQVRDLPADDPDYGGSTYSCVRYVAHAEGYARTSRCTDPRTGEILQANICLFHGLAERILLRRFLQTAVNDPHIRSGRMTDEAWAESIELYAAREMGHVLGLQDNLCASRAYEVDSLRSADFTAGHGISSSIMDEPVFNYIAQEGDAGVRLVPDLGAYDSLAVRWLYSPLPEVEGDEEKERILSSWLDEKAGLPQYRFANSRDVRFSQPDIQAGDLGNNAVRAGTYAVANLKKTVAALDGWVQDDVDGTLRKAIYDEMCIYFQNLLEYALAEVGGVCLHPVSDAGSAFDVVPREEQQASLRWVLKEFRECGWLEDPDLMLLSEFTTPKLWRMRKNFFHDPIGKEKNVSRLALWAEDPYRVEEFIDDLYTGVWENAIQNRPLTEADRYLQKTWFGSVEIRLRKLGGNALSKSFAGEPSGSGVAGPAACGIRPVYSLAVGGGKTDPDLANYSSIYIYKTMKKCEKLLEMRVVDGAEADRPHYRAMLFCVRSMLKEKK